MNPPRRLSLLVRYIDGVDLVQVTSLDLVRAIMGGDVPPDEIAEMEQEALAETGNVILNGCLATMANMLKRLNSSGYST